MPRAAPPDRAVDGLLIRHRQEGRRRHSAWTDLAAATQKERDHGRTDAALLPCRTAPT